MGAVGSTGRPTGPHLHLEIKVEGKLINPYPYIVQQNHEVILMQKIILYCVVALAAIGVVLILNTSDIFNEQIKVDETIEKLEIHKIEFPDEEGESKHSWSIEEGIKSTSDELVQSFVQSLKVKDYESAFMLFDTSYTDPLYKTPEEYYEVVNVFGEALTRQHTLSKVYVLSRGQMHQEYSLKLTYDDDKEFIVTLKVNHKKQNFPMNPFDLVNVIKE